MCALLRSASNFDLKHGTLVSGSARLLNSPRTAGRPTILIMITDPSSRSFLRSWRRDLHSFCPRLPRLRIAARRGNPALSMLTTLSSLLSRPRSGWQLAPVGGAPVARPN